MRGAGRGIEHLDRQVGDAGGAGGADGDAARVRPAVGDELGQAAGGEGLVHRDHLRRAAGEADRGEVPQRVIAEIGLDLRVDGDAGRSSRAAGYSHPAFAWAAARAPTLPPAPARFSTTTGWPSFSAMRGAMRRATVSELPPGA